MPCKKELDVCGVYKIETPNGNSYIGSSISIGRRWNEHKSSLRLGNHHSIRLQCAYEKHGENLKFSIVELCETQILNEREQYWIDKLGATLNTSAFVKNHWLDPHVREKRISLCRSPEWRKMRSKLASIPKPHWRRVDCSNGKTYESMASAAREFGTTTTHIKLLCENQTLGRLGFAFKFHLDDWKEVKTTSQRRLDSRIKNGKLKHTLKARLKMSQIQKKICDKAHLLEISKIGRESLKKPVVGKCLTSGMEINFKSQREAARHVNPERVNTASAQICKSIKGVKKSAYGYVWSYAS